MGYYPTVVYVEADTSSIWCEQCLNLREQNNIDEDGYPIDELFWTAARLSVGDSVTCTQCDATVKDTGTESDE